MKALGLLMLILLSSPVLTAQVVGSSDLKQSLSELSLFRRCYAQLTGHPVPLSHPSYVAVKNNLIKGIEACNALLDKATLDAGTGFLKVPQDQDGRRILNQLYAFHRSWFSSNTVEQIQGYGTEIGIGTIDVYDSTEPSLAVTRAALTDHAKYSEVLTLSTGVQAIREENNEIAKRKGWVAKNVGRRFQNNSQGEANVIEFRGPDADSKFDGANNQLNTKLIPFPIQQAGDLVGIRPTVISIVVPNFSFVPFKPGGADSAKEVPDLNYTFDFYKTLGGGVLGTPIYLMLNFGRELGIHSNGSTKLPRRWAQTNLNSFLCASLPALRESDIQSLVISGSVTPFRKASSCVSCHASLDQMAYTARNVVTAGSNFANTSGPTYSKATLLMSTFQQKYPSVAGWPDAPVENFEKQVPIGKLYFRSASGKLVDHDVQSIDGLGQAMTETDDYYLCAAKRYYSFFTGKNISLYDRTNPNNAELNKQLTEKNKSDRKLIENLAYSLKQDQSIKSLIKRIFSSEDYKKKDFGL